MELRALIVAVIAGVLQGIVEWLPVSSKSMIGLVFVDGGGFSGNTAYVMGLLANFGSFFAALYFFRSDILEALRGLRSPFAKTVEATKLRYLVIATFATAVVGLPIYAVVVHAFHRSAGAVFMAVVGIFLLATTVVNRRRERMARGSVGGSEAVPGAGGSAIVGAAQGLAALPGVSRSAVTVTPLLMLGETPPAALRFSFLLDVVGLLGAGLTPFLVGHAGFSALHQVGTTAMVVMVLVAAVVSFLAIGTMLKVASRLRSSTVTLVLGLVTLAGAALYAAGV